MSMNDNVIDSQVFAELQASAGADFVVELVGTFLEDAPELLAALERARASGDASAFRRVAHTLKSNSNTFGALALSAHARELELLDLAANIGQVPALLQQLNLSYTQAAAALRSMTHA